MYLLEEHNPPEFAPPSSRYSIGVDFLTTEASSSLRISVWRHYEPERVLAHYADSENEPNYLTSGSLEHEVFAWQVQEDVWGGLEDAEVRGTIRNRFLQEFDPFLRPDERRFSKFEHFLDELNRLIRSTVSGWSTSEHAFGDAPDDLPSRLNSLLALYHQLDWVYRTFKDVPGASISVR